LTRPTAFRDSSNVTTFDRLDWHLEAALDRGRPPESAFTHIGLFLAWLIRHDLHDPTAIPADLAGAVTSGAMSGPDLRDVVAGQLSSALLSDEGDAFTRAYYPAYLDDYAVAFADRPDYGVPDDADAYARIAPTIDRRFEEWQAAGDDDPTAPPIGLSGDALLAMSEAELDEAARELADAIAGSDDAADQFADAIAADPLLDGEGSGNGHPHDSPDLEALVPREVGGMPLLITSTRVSDWQSTLLRQAVVNVGADPAESFVAVGLGGTGEDTLAVTIYAIPGAPQDRLEAEFARPEYLAGGEPWQQREVDGRTVWWSAAEEFDTAFYALGGMVVTAGGTPARVRAALDVLP
jgi:hypothetical protein